MYLAIAIGGTKLQVAIGAGDGVLRGLWRETVNVPAGPEGIRRQILRAVPELLSQSAIDRLLEFQPDVCVTDFDSFAHVFGRIAGRPVISIDHHHVLDVVPSGH